MSFFAGLWWLLLLLARGVILWLVIPFAAATWLAVHWWAQEASIGQAVCWYDQTLWAFLILVPFRPLLYLDPRLRGTRFLSISEMRGLKTYKISLVADIA